MLGSIRNLRIFLPTHARRIRRSGVSSGPLQYVGRQNRVARSGWQSDDRNVAAPGVQGTGERLATHLAGLGEDTMDGPRDVVPLLFSGKMKV
jgi:hypothetical protein